MESIAPNPKEQLWRIVREAAFTAMVERGLVDAREGRVTSHEGMRQTIESWRK